MDIRKFLNDYKHLVESGDFETLYEKCMQRWQLTDFLLNKADINPLEYMIYIPSHFAYNLDIKDIHIPDNIKQIGWSAFEGSSIENINLENVLYIEMEAFQNCKNLKSIKLDNCRAISVNAFKNCKNLETAYIGSDIQSINPEAFTEDAVSLVCSNSKADWERKVGLSLVDLKGVTEIWYRG